MWIYREKNGPSDSLLYLLSPVFQTVSEADMRPQR